MYDFDKASKKLIRSLEKLAKASDTHWCEMSCRINDWRAAAWKNNIPERKVDSVYVAALEIQAKFEAAA